MLCISSSYRYDIFYVELSIMPSGKLSFGDFVLKLLGCVVLASRCFLEHVIQIILELINQMFWVIWNKF